MKVPAIFSFFAGAGFLDLGFEKSGYDVVYVNEYHAPFVDAYRHSRRVMALPGPKFGYDCRSISDVAAFEIKTLMETARGDDQIVGFIGGPPCPDFSVGGKNKGQEGDNGRLSQVYVDLVCAAKPDFFLFENVKGLYRTRKHRAFFDGLKEKLRNGGYNLHERLINSIEYGAPQDRERIILLGFRDDQLPETFLWTGRQFPGKIAFGYDWPQTSPFSPDAKVPRPNSLPLELTVQHWFEKNRVGTHPNAKHAFKPRAGLARFLAVQEGDDSKKSYKRLHRWRYSPTAAYGNNEVHLHPYLARRLSVAEALAIQSLPSEFELPPHMTLSNMFKTVGNGVPYLAAVGLATAILNHLGVRNADHSAELGASNTRTAA